MHPLFNRADSWTGKVIGAAIEVHKLKGPGLLEPLYEKFMMRECALQSIPVVQQLPIHKAQLMSYMKLLDKPIGLLINFHEMVLKDGISRLVLPGANK